jgi:hypothetical protein
VLNRTQYPSDVIALVVLWRLRHRLTLQELSEMVLERGIVFSRATAIYDYPDRGFGPMPNAEVHHTTLVILAASTAYVMSVADMAQRIIGEAGKAQAA